MNSSYFQFALATIAFVLFGVGYSFWYAYVARESTTVASLSAQIKSKTETSERASALANAITELAKNETSVQSYFVTESNIVPFLESLESIGTNLGSKVKIPSVGASTKANQPVLVISIQISGSFDSVMRTIGAIEFAPYAISVTSLSITQTGSDTDASWNASMSITVGSNAPGAPVIEKPAPVPQKTSPSNTSIPPELL